MESIYTLHVKDLEGNDVAMSSFEGKVALVVNVASACGYTRQYEGLEALYRAYGARGLVVLGFPSNEFGGQEPGSAEEIRSFCTSRFQVTFPMLAKVEVKAGPGQSPVYKALSACGQLPTWNFGKYLVDRQGRVLDFYPSAIEPGSDLLRTAIEAALGAEG